LAAAQVGQHNEKRQSYGHSLAYDSWGELLADAGGYDGPGMLDLITNIIPHQHHLKVTSP
jgi:predicted amidohydrolase